MAKRSKTEEKAPQKAPEKLAQPFKSALSKMEIKPTHVKAAPPKKTFAALFEAQGQAPAAPTPSPAKTPNAVATRSTITSSERSKDDQEALHDAFAGVRPMNVAKGMRVPRLPPGSAQLTRGKMPDYIDADAEVRKRLGALVAGGVRFFIGKRDDDFIFGVRSDADEDAWEALAKESAHADDALDLHGFRAEAAEAAVVKFVRTRYRRGARIVRIVHGKGLHSESGVSVLRDAVLHALTELGAAPIVVAFATAHPKHGGSGAMFVKLG